MSGETLTLQSKLVATDDFFKVPVDQRILRNSENECIWKMDWYRTFQDGSVKTEREKTTDRQRAIYLYKMGLDVEGGDHDKKGIEKTKEQDDKSDCYDKWNGDVTENREYNSRLVIA
jgi:hypothetical protein